MGPGQTEQARGVRVPRWLAAACRISALLGGLVIVALMLVTVASVLARAVLGWPVPGDYELVEFGSAIAIFCFLPWAQATQANVLVDFFTQGAGPRLNHALEALGDLLYLGIAALLLWRLSLGAEEMHRYAEQSMVLRLPIWWSFVVILPAMALLALTCAFTAAAHLARAAGAGGRA